MSDSNVVRLARSYIQEELKQNDFSHNYEHIERVEKMSLKLAKMEGITNEETLEIIQLSALLHDLKDYKYSGDENAGPKATREFLEKLNYPKDNIERIVFVIENISFKNELSKNSPKIESTKELEIVMDADRLDAIGAMGITRCFSYSLKMNRKIYDPKIKPRTNLTKDSYMNNKEESTALNHFYEKLFLLKDKMKTKSGFEIAQKREDFMKDFVDQFLGEWNGEK
eukprot:gene3959-7215_t